MPPPLPEGSGSFHISYAATRPEQREATCFHETPPFRRRKRRYGQIAAVVGPGRHVMEDGQNLQSVLLGLVDVRVELGPIEGIVRRLGHGPAEVDAHPSHRSE